jgi:hypothetical protein
MRGERTLPFFYPATCHPARLTRRQLLAGSVAFVAAGALSTRDGRAGDDGTAIIRQWATLPDDPWAVCHGLRAMGRDFTIKGGRRAVDWLLETQLASMTVNGQQVLAFPASVEVHPNMFLKTLLEAGVPLDYRFTHQGQQRTVREVVEGARMLFRPSEVITQANMLPWSLIAFARTTSPVRRRLTNAWGEPVDLDLVVESALRLLEDASLSVAQAMREGHEETVKAPVHGFTCGGTHMLYGLLSAVHAGYAGRDRLDRVRRQGDLLVWRLAADPRLIDSFYRQRAPEPGTDWYKTQAKIKLLGHGEECLAFGTRRGVLKLSGAQRQQWQAAQTALRRMLEDIEGWNLTKVREADQNLFQQLVGDTCHARHGLRFA